MKIQIYESYYGEGMIRPSLPKIGDQSQSSCLNLTNVANDG